MPNPIHIVEPTLENSAGHCHSFITSLCLAAPRDQSFIVWTGRGAGPEVLKRLPNVETRPYFHRSLRRLEALPLYRKLLQDPGKILVSTAGTADLLLLNAIASGDLPVHKAYLYFHWSKERPGKLERYRRIARRLPSLGVLGPTPQVVEFLRRVGFEGARLAPYPLTVRAPLGESARLEFRHLLFAGAARRDKGFNLVVDLLVLLATRGARWPVVIQAAPDHYDKLGKETRRDLRRLKTLDYRELRLVPNLPEHNDYLELFPGSICLQPYDAHDFEDRISGVTLDALTSGAPLVPTAGTWMARVVSRFDAGVVLERLSAESLREAAERVRSEYPRYHRNAIRAGVALREEHSAGQLLKILQE